MAALQNPQRIERLIILNAPHPLVFQRSMFDGSGQREASQYIRAFRNPDIDKFVARIGIESFFDTSFANHADAALLAQEKPVYVDQWSQPGAMPTSR